MNFQLCKLRKQNSLIKITYDSCVRSFTQARFKTVSHLGVVGSKRNFIDVYVSEGLLESYQILDKSPISSKGDDIMDDYFLVGKFNN